MLSISLIIYFSHYLSNSLPIFVLISLFTVYLSLSPSLMISLFNDPSLSLSLFLNIYISSYLSLIIFIIISFIIFIFITISISISTSKSHCTKLYLTFFCVPKHTHTHIYTYIHGRAGRF